MLIKNERQKAALALIRYLFFVGFDIKCHFVELQMSVKLYVCTKQSGKKCLDLLTLIEFLEYFIHSFQKKKKFGLIST